MRLAGIFGVELSGWFWLFYGAPELLKQSVTEPVKLNGRASVGPAAP